MKKLLQMSFLTALTVGMVRTADAQRIRNAGGSSDRGSNRVVSSQPRVDRSSRSAPVRTFRENPSTARNNTANRDNVRPTPQRNADNYRPTPQRNADNNRPSARRNNVVTRNSTRPNIIERNRYGNNYNYRYNNAYYGSRYRNGYGRHTVFMYGPRYRVVPRNSVSIYFGGNPYYYNQGFFYGYYDGYYQPLFPPFGIRVNVLPFGYSRFYVGLNPYYYYNGIYYRQYDNDDYEVVDAPMGATVSSLPRGAKSVKVNGEKLYELNGTYYKRDKDSRGKNVYMVVGKNGEINNEFVDNDRDENVFNTVPPASLQIGDVVGQLPEGSKVATIKGEKVYLTPDDNYLKEETKDGIVQYRVVGN